MKRTAILALLVVMGLMVPGTSHARPAGPQTDPLGTLQWLPDFASQRPRPDVYRLVVTYDRSLNQAGKPGTLLAKGAFGVKLAALSPDMRMVGHSTGLDVLGLPPFTSAVDQWVMALEGDVRDGDCDKVGTAAFSEAYSYTSTFLAPQPYQPKEGPGVCEQVISSQPQAGGYRTQVITHVPGFWIDVAWPERNGGRPLPEVWYEAAYDSQGEAGRFYLTADAVGASRSVSAPPS